MQYENRADEFTEAELRSMISQAGEEIADEDGQVIGFISAPAKIKVNRPYLANGGYLVISRDEDSGDFIAVEYDALWDRKKQRHYPSGYSERIFAAPSLDEAVARVIAYLAGEGPSSKREGEP